jgi:hypothetical protein
MTYNVADFFSKLFQETPMPSTNRSVSPGAYTCPDDLPADWHFLWDERAAIMEFDAGMPRERAEALAFDDILRQMRLTGQSFH